ncbi:VasL domain-containing protein [Leclercia adecarboxylata]|uniref:VasL domain-containing protein n=1 Tax=Leclercia adecarboxylata TaxID=83655 RepID=A0ABU6I915_9ENTR|nr:VasL domain-containing protein [Leclercia adecarboxylata]MBZ3799378.1 type VI secretion system ImpA family N-terminal domain-containing protein [Leclercia adecarboxylata]MBZ3803461.1 type VI secretion system ImpA family N-terminal domain-containing protein [Leclercia adecarboxylata]MDV5239637.1 VasL domain-containing protein [Leclercia adecarboxylata]MDV5276200.1 VasL domain-containing protein [Leclercia adecarboxylata]MDV5461216.1 VasL domain-containing protein [Leclercia adecarboxylata]
MTTSPERHLKTGGDPRAVADYVALREEMSKLTHPARPDVDWPYAEKLCLSLFEQNGVELQTAAWYTLVRTQRAGMYGLNEGLAILAALVSRQWENLWPRPVNARMEILRSLSKRLQQVMRTLPLTRSDQSQLYQVEAHLKALEKVLQRLELKHVSQLDALLTQVHNSAVRLENSAHETVETEETVIPDTAIDPPERTKWVYVTQRDSDAVSAPSQPTKHWMSFAAGMLTMLVVAGAAVWGWQAMHQPDPVQAQFTASLAPLSVALSPAQLQAMQNNPLSAETGLSQTAQHLARLAQLKPDWVVSYGGQLVQQALTLWPEQAKPLALQWQQQIAAQALPSENLSGWYQGMARLQQLANQLNALDEKRGKYMTVSELKSQVFTIMQSFNRAIPVEEQLRQLSAVNDEQPWPVAQQNLAELHLQQLIARYALLKQKALD